MKKKIKLAIFDMDGTIFESHFDWQHIREQLGIKPGDSILQTIYQEDQIDNDRLILLENYERQNSLQVEPIDGVHDFLDYLRSQDIIVVLATNNNHENTQYLLEKYSLQFFHVLTRESKLWKPHPDAFILLMDKFNCRPDETISIGDSYYDIKASRSANIPHIYVINGNPNLQAHPKEPDIVYFDDYNHLQKLIDVGTPT
jgi:HAD superfamily hydrolase (TIGR01549 family)